MTVTDETTREDVIEALGHVNETAKKCKQVVGNDIFESPWDKSHTRINELLDHLESVEA